MLLNFTFDTDITEYWERLRQTMGEQLNYMILPCGHHKGHVSVFRLNAWKDLFS